MQVPSRRYPNYSIIISVITGETSGESNAHSTDDTSAMRHRQPIRTPRGVIPYTAHCTTHS